MRSKDAPGDAVSASSRSGEEHDRDAAERDRVAAERDRDADDRDGDAELRYRRSEDHGRAAGTRRPSRVLARRKARAEHEQAVVQQAAAAADRHSAALDRRLAAQDRRDAAVERFSAGHDDLTGVLRRGIGLVELQREMDRSRRLGSDLVVTFFDVDDLKRINDEHGHAAGDEALRTVGKVLSTRLRSYDVIMRYGGDEFVTAQSGMNFAGATERVLTVQAELSTATAPLFVSFGLARFEADDCIATLISRADADLYEQRRRTRGRHQHIGPREVVPVNPGRWSYG